MTDFRNSPLWLKAMELAVEVDRVTKILAKADGTPARATAQHVYNLDAEKIVLDIATAEGRSAIPNENLRFLSSAQGATFRLESRLLLDVKRDNVAQADVEKALKLCTELAALLNSKIEELSAERERRFERRLNEQILSRNFRADNEE